MSELTPIKDRLAAYLISVDPCRIEGKRTLRHQTGVVLGSFDAKEACELLDRLDGQAVAI